MTTALIVADDILKIAKRKNISLTSLHVVKLAYIAYGRYLARTGKDLFRDRIEAWRYGPVIPSVYYRTKRFGRDYIPANLISDKPVSDPELESFFTRIVDDYGSYPAVALSHLTHREGTPWDRTYEPGVLRAEIPRKYIREHYD